MVARALALVVFAAGCTADEPAGDCPPDQIFESARERLSCTRTFCGAPVVEVATGSGDDGTFRLLDADDVLPVVWGPQGGYHVDLAVQTTNLCPVIYMDYALWDVTDGDERLVSDIRRHERAFPAEEDSPTNRWWTQQLAIPCAYWPDDPQFEEPVDCGEERFAPIEERALRVDVRAADHNEGRVGEAALSVRVECCADGT